MEKDDDGIEIPAHIECTIKSIQIPRFLPSLLFVVWRGNSFKGQTKLYRANAPQKIIEESFRFIAHRNNPIELFFSVNAKSPSGSIFRFGENKMTIDNSIFDFKPIDTTFTIATESGDLIVNISMKRIQIDQFIEDKSLSVLLQGPSSITKYQDDIHKISTSIEMSLAKDYWGIDTGIPKVIQDLATNKKEFIVIEGLENLLPVLEDKTLISKKTASLIQNSAKIIFNKAPLFITEEGNILSGNDAKEYKNPKFPLLGVFLLKSVQDIEQNPIPNYNINDPILTVGTILTGIADSLHISDDLLFYIMQSSLFFAQGVSTQFPDKYVCADTIFTNVAKKAIMTHLENLISNTSQYIEQPRRILNIIKSSRQLMTIYGIQESIWNEIEKFLLPTLDFLVAKSWLLSEKIEPVSSSTFLSMFPQYDWQYLIAFEKIYENSEKIIKEGKDICHQLHIPRELRGVWLKQALLKRVKAKQIKFNSKDVEKHITDNIQPSMYDISEFVQHNPNIVGRINIPQTIPNIPDIYL